MIKDYNNMMVQVLCMTFNQSRYIEDAMNGFTMQETTFPYVCIILDDASTDGEQEVIKNYLRVHFDMDDKETVRNEETDDYVLSFAQHKTNKNCYFAVLFLKYNHYNIKKSRAPYYKEWTDTKYTAYCEGDDYWIDKNKLQRQVDFLEAHPDYTLFFHNALVRYQNHNQPDKLISYFQSGDFTTAMLFEKWQLPLASVLLRKEVFVAPIKQELEKVCHGGFVLFITASRIGKVYGLSECLSVYRKNDGGISNKMSPACCMQIDYGFAKASGDKDAMKVMDNKALKKMVVLMPKLLRRDKNAKEIASVIHSYNKHIFFYALFKYICSIPMKAIRKFKNLLITLCGIVIIISMIYANFHIPRYVDKYCIKHSFPSNISKGDEFEIRVKDAVVNLIESESWNSKIRLLANSKSLTKFLARGKTSVYEYGEFAYLLHYTYLYAERGGTNNF